MLENVNTTDSSESNVRTLASWRRTASKQELSILPAGSSFQIQVLGDALTGQGVHHGDTIDCERVTTLEQGQDRALKDALRAHGAPLPL